MRTIHFEDHGQDFLRWTVDDRGVVVKCEPFQGWVWEGAIVLDVSRLRAGDVVEFVPRDGAGIRTVKYRITQIEEHPQ